MKSVRSFCVAMVATLLAIGFSGQLPAADAAPESTDALKKLNEDIVAALKASDKDKAAELIKGLVLPAPEAWFTKTFGPDAGKALATDYPEPAKAQAELLKAYQAALKKDAKEVTAYKLDPADPKNGTGLQTKAIEAMKEKVPLYGVRFAGFHLWNFAYVDGAFRYVGKLRMK